ncbi:hypothetical protein CMQ_1149 [Grosmannia clavigera kw1407]|uniref:Uncharacterized protein n=1 Tax=Grosmannia clavigera (strain kw1407 / UAMH 11150) TaxID=655863 RepID=F0XDQ3_GROCL|nr:uncharacterized protein CMQ_1149 [Grosmannia clavigera kw1407]EFX04221.1 hypothetical protein CMQ_1149 [Grosmannia clavigera kw1407]
MEVANPRRILAVSLVESQEHLSTVIKDLTGAYPERSAGTGSLAGTTQELFLDTPYYSARVPVWLDLIGAEEQAEQAEPAEDVPAVGEPAKASEEVPAQDHVTNAKGDVDGTAGSGAAAAASPMTPRQWADAFLEEEAREVRAALGGVVVVLEMNSSTGAEGGPTRPNRVEQQRDLIRHVGRLIQEGLGVAALDDNDGEEAREYYDDSWDGVGLVVGIAPRGTGPPLAEDLLAEWEDACIAAGLEFVLVASGQAATNEFGEKTGIPRVLEALQANDWNQADGLGLDGDGVDDGDFEFGAFQDSDRELHRIVNRGDGDGSHDDGDELFDPESLDFGFDRTDFAGLREAIWRQSTRTVEGGAGDQDAAGAVEDEEDDGVQSVERMMQKLLAARDLGAGLPPDQRRRLAARAVGEVMREL